jgi:hypothetical protein
MKLQWQVKFGLDSGFRRGGSDMNFAFIAEPWSIWAWLCNRLGVPRLVWDRLPAIPILAGARAQRFPSDLCENLDPKSRLLAGAVRVESAVRSVDCAGPASPAARAMRYKY